MVQRRGDEHLTVIRDAVAIPDDADVQYVDNHIRDALVNVANRTDFRPVAVTNVPQTSE